MTPGIRVCAVSYLNTAPLVWGLLHGPQRGLVDLGFALPSACADQLRTGDADVGLVPVIELARQPGLTVLPGSCIACQGAVRSILLVSKGPLDTVETLAADTGSRTSVVLAQIIAERTKSVRLKVFPHAPDLDAMLEVADAALVIGDGALEIDEHMDRWRDREVQVLDLGAAWEALTGLPMVFAVWAARLTADSSGVAEILAASSEYGRGRVEEIVRMESQRLGMDADLVRAYLTRHVSYDLGERERLALRTYLDFAAQMGLVEPGAGSRIPAIASSNG